MKNDVSFEMYNAMKIMARVMTKYDPECAVELNSEIEKLSVHFQNVEITAEMVHDLRLLTGEGMMACKKALVHSKGVIVDAVEYIRVSGNICV